MEEITCLKHRYYADMIERLLENDNIHSIDKVLVLGCNEQSIYDEIVNAFAQHQIRVDDQPYTIYELYEVIIYFYLPYSIERHFDILTRVKDHLVLNGKLIFFTPLLSKLDMLINLIALRPKWRKAFQKFKQSAVLLTYHEYLQLLNQAGFDLSMVENLSLSLDVNNRESYGFLLNWLPTVSKLDPLNRREFMYELMDGYIMNTPTKSPGALDMQILKVIMTVS